MGILNSFLPYSVDNSSSLAFDRPAASFCAVLRDLSWSIRYLDNGGLADEGYGKGWNTRGSSDFKTYVSRWYVNVNVLDSLAANVKICQLCRML